MMVPNESLGPPLFRSGSSFSQRRAYGRKSDYKASFFFWFCFLFDLFCFVFEGRERGSESLSSQLRVEGSVEGFCVVTRGFDFGV